MLENLDSLIRTGTRRPLWPPSEAAQTVSLGREEIYGMIPHRDPFLFVDRITEIDRVKGLIRGERVIDVDDPVFAGHFPGQPVYPGVLQLETIGQLGLCLIHLMKGLNPGGLRAVRIHHASFLSEVGPGQKLEIVAARIQADEFTAVCSGQILRSGVICAFGIMEVYFVEG